VGEAGHQRIASLPPVLADDLIPSLSFAPGERVIVTDAQVIVHPPRTVADLLRRRVRAAVGVTQIEQAENAPEATARTRPATCSRSLVKVPRWQRPAFRRCEPGLVRGSGT
jgi:hypothetical protein